MGKIRYLMVNPDIKPCPFCFQRKVVIICRGGIMFFALSLGLLLGLLLDFVGVTKKAVNEKGGDYSPAVCYSADEAIRVLEAYHLGTIDRTVRREKNGAKL